MNRKNDYDLAFGPSDQNGEITVSKADLIREARQVADFFVMDYADVDGPNAGDVLVTVLDLTDIDRAITAHDMFAPAGVRYPPNWKTDLLNARENLRSARAGVRADVQFDFGPPNARLSAEQREQ